MRSPIVSPEVLSGWLTEGRADLRVVDVRWYLGQPQGTGRTAYEAGHLPGAIHVDIDEELTARSGPGRHPLPNPTAFAAALARLGIGDGQTIVVYDDVGGWVAARLWWMLEDLGFGDDRLGVGSGAVLVLDGGLPAWVAAGLALSTDVPHLSPARLTLASAWRRVVDRAALKTRLGDVLLLDARGGPRYRGEIEPIDPVAGHIPTAVSAPTDGNLGPDGRFRSPTDLAARFEELRATAAAGLGTAADPYSPVVVSCGSGISACHDALALRIAGSPDPILYPGSYSDWSTAGEPVVTGPEPGDRPARAEDHAAETGRDRDGVSSRRGG